jgi:signal transduction histidine kinase/CheY-like chemotaxis protein
MANTPANQDTRAQRPPRIVAPKPRSMQSRFILMEAGSVALALLLMAAALGISILIRSRLSSDLRALQQQLSMHTQIYVAYDRMLLDFWRCFPPPSAPNSLASYREDTGKLRSLLSQLSNSSASAREAEEATQLQQQLESFLAVTDRLLAGPQTKEQIASGEVLVMAKTDEMGRMFKSSGQQEFARLDSANRRLDVYNRSLYALLVVLGFYPIVVMLWFRHAQEEQVWAPLEQLYRMIMEVKRGNLNVNGEIPNTVEFGSLTSGFLAMASELSDMRDSLEEKVRLRAAQLEAANKDLVRAAKLAALGQLVSGVAHEINNPLTSILGFSEIVLSRPGLQPSLRSQLQTIRSEAIRLKHLVANLSSFSRSKPQNFSRVDLRRVGDRLLELRSYQLTANNIKIQYQRPDEPVWVNADDEQLLDVLLNLVMNSEQAIRSSHDRGQILLSCEERSGWAILTVKDDGCGMSAEVRDNIFDPFFTTKPTGKGTGLGLSISHTIVDHHGGEITIDSAPGKGATVRITLPVANGDDNAKSVSKPSKPTKSSAVESAASDASHAALTPRDGNGGGTRTSGSISREAFALDENANREPAPMAISPEASAHSSATPMRILAIDDEPEILNLLSFALGKSGAQVVTLQDSSQLASVLNGDSFDVVLCDLKMPGQDGLAVLRSLRQSHPKLAQRFLLMTGNLADADKSELELEGVPVLPKPFTLGRLREMLAEVLAAND